MRIKRLTIHVLHRLHLDSFGLVVIKLFGTILVLFLVIFLMLYVIYRFPFRIPRHISRVLGVEMPLEDE